MRILGIRSRRMRGGGRAHQRDENGEDGSVQSVGVRWIVAVFGGSSPQLLHSLSGSRGEWRVE